MKAELKNYIHLYLGCPCLIGDSTEIQYVRMVNETGLSVCTGTNAKNIPTWYKTSWCKPILRPVSSISKKELLKLMNICFRHIYGYNPKFLKVEVNSTGEDYGIMASTSDNVWNYGLVVNESYVLFTANGSFLNMPNYETTRYLLSIHIDLFGLIKAGLAVSKTKDRFTKATALYC